MRRTFVWLCAVSLAVAAHAVPAQDGRRIDRSTLLHLGASVLKVEAIGADGRYQLGSAVVVGERQAVTNCHVTRNARTVHVVKGGARLAATQQAADVAHDLCVLHVPRLDGADAVVPIAPAGSLRTGEDLLAIGYTGGAGLQVSDGRVVALHRHDGSQIVQSSTRFNSGASGGGLFDAAGRLVGILTFRLRGGAAHYFAAPADWLLGRIDDASRYAAIGPLQGRSFWEELPDAQPMFLQAAALEQRRQWPGLVELAERWARDNGDDPEPPFVLGLAYDGQGDTQASIAALKRCIELDPGYARAWARLAMLYQREGRVADAREALARLDALEPDPPRTLTKELDSPMSPSMSFPLPHALVALALACAATLPVRAADPSEFSRAEKLVFTEHHLGNLKPPSGLRYTYVRTGTAKDSAFEDDAQIDVTGDGKACCTVHGRFLSGTRQLSQLPDIVDAKSNPIILYFLENDIREMAKETKRRDGGGYFRNRIRKAMVDEAEVKDTTVDYDGKKLPAQEVTLSPYVKDPARARYERLATKRYSFVLAKGVPGGVYRVATVLPGAQPADAPVQQDVLTLVGPVAPGAATAAATAASSSTTPAIKK